MGAAAAPGPPFVAPRSCKCSASPWREGESEQGLRGRGHCRSEGFRFGYKRKKRSTFTSPLAEEVGSWGSGSGVERLGAHLDRAPGALPDHSWRRGPGGELELGAGGGTKSACVGGGVAFVPAVGCLGKEGLSARV